MNNYELKHYLSSNDVQVVCSDDLPAVAKKHQFWIVNTDECGEKVYIGSFIIFPQKDLWSSLIPLEIPRNIIIGDFKVF